MAIEKNSFGLDPKRMAKLTIKNKIEELIRNRSFINLEGITGKPNYTDLDDFIKRNPDYETFKQNTLLDNTIRKTWGCNITEEDYQEILAELKLEADKKKEIVTDGLTTLSANGREVVTFESSEGTVVLDNTYSGKNIEEQMEDVQKRFTSFGEAGEQNTENIINFMQDEIKPEMGFQSINGTNMQSVSDEDKETLNAAKAYTEAIGEDAKVDLEHGIIEYNGNIQSIEKRDDGMGIYDADNVNTEEDEKELAYEVKPKVKTLTKPKMPQAGFVNACVLAFGSGILIGIIALSLYAELINL